MDMKLTILTSILLILTQIFDIRGSPGFLLVEIKDKTDDKALSDSEKGSDYSNDEGEPTSKEGSGECETIDGPGAGKPCIFPFKFRGETYEECTIEGGPDVHQFWCSTKVTEDGENISGNWASCSKGCPGVTSDGFRKATCPAIDEPECFFPFRFEGMIYNGCVRFVLRLPIAKIKTKTIT